MITSNISLWGINDRDEDAHRVATLLRDESQGQPDRAEPHPDVDLSPLHRSGLSVQEILIGHHLTAILRKSKGQDISAASGN